MLVLLASQVLQFVEDGTYICLCESVSGLTNRMLLRAKP
jgi:hypothetical protein